MERRFLSWRRRGLAVGLPSNAGAARQADVTVTAELDGRNENIQVAIPLAGPGDVEGLTEGALTKRWPAPGSVDTPEGLMAYAEFAEDDLPWRYADTTARPTPWMALIVVEEGEEGVILRGDATPNPMLELSSEAVARLPLVTEVFACAHVEVLAGGDAVARIVSARRLEADKAWRALLVPTSEAGRLAGLGEPVAGADGPAWQEGNATRLPVYAQWSFRTSRKSGFEDAVKTLAPAEDLAQGAFYRWSEETNAAIGVAQRVAVSFQRAILKPVGARFDGVSDPPGFTAPRPVHVVARGVEAVLGTADAVTPPRYGADHLEPGPRPAWFDDINLDPSLRAVAGLGAEIVRERQESLVREAWELAGEIDEANFLIGAARMGAAATARGYMGLAKLDDAGFVAATAPLQARTPSLDGRSMAAQLDGVPEAGAGSTYVQRAMRPAALARTGAADAARGSPAELANSQAGAVLPRGAPTISSGADARGTGLITSQEDAIAILDLGFDIDLRDRRLQEGGRDAEQILEAGRAGPGRDEGTRALPEVDLAAAASHLRRALAPEKAIGARVDARIAGNVPGQPLETIRIEPEIDLPLIEVLAERNPGHVLPAIGSLKPETMTLVDLDRPACEALMLGANHELMRELMWRGYPGRRDMTPLRRLFPRPHTAPAGLSADTAPIANWRGKAGAHLSEGIGAVLVIRSAILSLFPEMALYVFPATWQGEATRALADPSRHAPVMPVLQGRLGEDASFLAFPEAAAALAGAERRPAGVADGSTEQAGYWLVFQGPAGRDAFGFDDPAGPIAAQDIGTLTGWDDLTWAHVGWTEARPVFSPSRAATGMPMEEANSGLSLAGDAAQLAAIMTTRPLTVTLHMSDLIP